MNKMTKLNLKVQSFNKLNKSNNFNKFNKLNNQRIKGRVNDN